jgi:hypothetical protein
VQCLWRPLRVDVVVSFFKFYCFECLSYTVLVLSNLWQISCFMSDVIICTTLNITQCNVMYCNMTCLNSVPCVVHRGAPKHPSCNQMLFSIVIVRKEFYGQNCMGFKIGNKFFGNETKLIYFVANIMNRNYKYSRMTQQ